MEKIAIDARWMVGDFRGMGRYAYHLIEPVKNRVDGLVPKGVASNKINIVPKGWSFFPWWEQKLLPELVEMNGYDVLVCPYNTGPIRKLKNAKLVLVIHDLIFLRSWQELPPSVSVYQTLGRIYRRWNVSRVIRNADVLLTVSEYTKHEVIKAFGISEDLIKVIPNSISKSWLSDSFLPIEKREPYLFSVAGNAPSKNVERLLQAFALAKKTLPENVRLKIAGINKPFHAVFYKIAEKEGVHNYVDFLGFVSEAELRTLYKNSRCFIFASLFEGFGIPLIEAMASGVPVASSNSTSLPEVVGDAALLFDPLELHEISAAIIKIMQDENLSEKMIIKGRERVEKFTDDIVSQQFIKLWEQIDAS